MEKLDFPVIPRPIDDEVAIFHPATQYALERALGLLDLENDFRVQHHFDFPGGIIDFVIIRNSTGKVLLPIEVKRTKQSVRSSGRRQSRDYFNNLGNLRESKYYCSTNLELTELFRDDVNRPKTTSQQVQLEGGDLGSALRSAQDFYAEITSVFMRLISICLEDSGTYSSSYDSLSASLTGAVEDVDRWHRNLMPYSFEFIRAVAGHQPNFQSKLRAAKWAPVDSYSRSPFRLVEAASLVDFKAIFSEPIPRPDDQDAFSSGLVDEAHRAGKAGTSPDNLAELIAEILSESNRGVVETDPELAQLLAVLAKSEIGEELGDRRIFDPGAATGRLLLAAKDSFPDAVPGQFWANDIEKRFLEIVSLRLGLEFGEVITPGNSPMVTAYDIGDLRPDSCSQVGLVLMNPPFMSGIESTHLREKLSRAIHKVTGRGSILNSGQIALEAIFLELVVDLVPENTVIATVFPAQHLLRRSREVVRLRQFLTDKFGLTQVAIYPQRGIFQSVTKQSIILVGVKGTLGEQVKVIQSSASVSSIDLSTLLRGLSLGEAEPARAVSVTAHSRSDLRSGAENGWRSIVGSGQIAARLIDREFSNFKTLGEMRIIDSLGRVRKCLSRGTMGNSGQTHLTSIDPSGRNGSLLQKLPDSWWVPGLNHVQGLPRIANPENLQSRALFPPREAFVDGTREWIQLVNFIEAGHSIFETAQANSKQTRRSFNSNQVVKKIQNDQRLATGLRVLIPRAARKVGQVSSTDGGIIISTNLVAFEASSEREHWLMLSWVLSIFSQLQFEYSCALQEGMRKLELGTIGLLRIPDFNLLDDSLCNELAIAAQSVEPLDLENPIPSVIDELWGDLLFGPRSAEMVEEFRYLLQSLVSERLN